MQALQAGLDDRELGRIQHHRHARDVGLGGDEIEEPGHGGFAVEHGVIHVDVDDLGAAHDLAAGDVEGRIKLAVPDQFGEFGRARDVGALADIDETGDLSEVQRLQPRQTAVRRGFGQGTGRLAVNGLGNGADMVRRRATTAADHIDETAVGEFAQLFGHVFRRVVVLAEFVGQAGVGINADIDVGDGGDGLNVGAQIIHPEGAVEADADGPGMGDGIPEGFRRLARQGAPRGIRDGAGDHHRKAYIVIVEILVDGVDRGLGIERIENGFDQHDIDAAFDKAMQGLVIGDDQIVEGDIAEPWIVDVGRHRRGAVGRPDGAGNEPRFFRRSGGSRVGARAGDFGGLDVEFVNKVLEPVIGLRNGGRIEGVGLDDVGAGVQEGVVDALDDVRPGQGQQIVVALQVGRMVGEALATEIGFFQGVALDHGAHGAVQHQNALGENIFEGFGHVLELVIAPGRRGCGRWRRPDRPGSWCKNGNR